MQEPTAVAPIGGLKILPTGSRVTFAGQVIRCFERQGKRRGLLGDESGFIQVEGPGVEDLRRGNNVKIEHGLLKRHPTHEEIIHLDRDSRVDLLKEPVEVKRLPR